MRIGEVTARAVVEVIPVGRGRVCVAVLRACVLEEPQ